MKKLFYFLVIFPILSFSQSYTIEYDVNLYIIKRTGILNYNKNSQSFYFETSKIGTSNYNKQEEDGTYNKVISLGGNNEELRYQIYNKVKDNLLNIDYLEGKHIICEEKFNNMEWKLEDESKLISNYLCHKATTEFRGRKYIAWYSIDLPIFLGPWKFNNLPGAIIQVYDESNTFLWSMTKITKNKNDKVLEIDNTLKQISLQQFVEKDENLKKEKSEKALLKYAERGATIVSRTYERGRELKFEWEK